VRYIIAAAIIIGGCLISDSVHAQVDVPPIISPLDTGGLRFAVRLDPPPPPPPPVLWTTEAVNGHCVGLEGALAHFSPGWDVRRMSGIAYRESRCQPSASNSCCSGVLQMHRMHVPEPSCGVFSRNDLYDPWKNICAAAELWRSSGYSAWSTS